MQTVGIPEDEQVEVLSSCLAALCCARSIGPKDAHVLADVVGKDIHQRVATAFTMYTATMTVPK